MSATILVGTEAEVGGLTGWFVDLMESIGGPGAGLAIFVENVFPPLPSELFLPLAGFTAAQGKMSLLSALVWTTLGSVLGAILLYYIGATIGRERIRAIAGKLPLVNVSDLDKTEAWFAKHGTKAVFLGRMLPIFRSLISVPAGIERMPIVTFTVLTTLGSAIWNTALVMAGYKLGDNWHRVEDYAGVMQKFVIAGVLIFLVWFVWTRVQRRRRSKNSGAHAR
ncbi:DedA family protein [Streptomyces sp. S063]|uniref:DedA family protein n=1 Tax=Streptomyces sp. S063 TaxID=2005885 RepID=UPI003FCD8DB4